MSELFKRSFEAPKQSFFLFGPRGSGKSTLVKRLFPKALMIDLLLTDIRRRLMTNPEHLIEIVRAEPDGQVIIIDEIQKIPELLSIIHHLIEEKRGWIFILTGSSARKLKRADVDLLGGRALYKTLHPFMASELGEEFKLAEALSNGLLPLRFGIEDVQALLTSYISLYLEEEVKIEGLTRNIEPFYRFVEAMSFSHGSVLNLNNIARECGVKRSSVENWISILEDLLIGFQIPIFTKKAKRLLISHPKFYYFDVGVFRALRPRSILDQTTEIEGAAIEGLVAQHLRAWIDYTKEPHRLYFWRTKAGLEIDFIVYGTQGLWAIEVKNGTTVHPQDLRGLKNFLEDYPEATAIYLYRGSEKMVKDNILCMPCEEFLRNLTPNQPIYA